MAKSIHIGALLHAAWITRKSFDALITAQGLFFIGVPCYGEQCQRPSLSKSSGDNSPLQMSSVSIAVIAVGCFIVFIVIMFACCHHQCRHREVTTRSMQKNTVAVPAASSTEAA
jgi:hypothetical protein